MKRNFNKNDQAPPPPLTVMQQQNIEQHLMQSGGALPLGSLVRKFPGVKRAQLAHAFYVNEGQNPHVSLAPGGSPVAARGTKRAAKGPAFAPVKQAKTGLHLGAAGPGVDAFQLQQMQEYVMSMPPPYGQYGAPPIGGRFPMAQAGQRQVAPMAPTDSCADFRMGRCNRGDMCRYAHVSDGGHSAFSMPLQQMPFAHHLLPQGKTCSLCAMELKPNAQFCGGCGTEVSSQDSCADFRMGRCQRGEMCRYSHDLSGGPQVQRSDESCADFRHGKCQRGDMCRYTHAIDGSFNQGGGQQGGGHVERKRAQKEAAPPLDQQVLARLRAYLANAGGMAPMGNVSQEFRGVKVSQLKMHFSVGPSPNGNHQTVVSMM